MNRAMNRDYDALVVGSGAGGSAAAYRLARAGLRVLLIEKGRELPTDGSTLDVASVVTEGRFLARETWRDRKGNDLQPEEHFNLGGKTKWYGAALIRYAPHEFEADETHGCAPWPITYSEMAPYYEEAERLLGVRYFECEPDLRRIVSRLTAGGGWRAEQLPLGLAPDIIDDDLEATHFDGFASVRGLKADAQTALLARVGGANRLTLVTGTAVESLLAAEDDERRVVGVRTVDGREFRGRVTLLAAGALHSPRLLQRYVDAHGLEHRLPAAGSIGRHLKLHLLTAMVSMGVGRKIDRLRKTILLLNERFPHSSVQPLGFDAELMERLLPSAVPRALARQVAARAYGFFLQTEDGASPDNRVLSAQTGDPRPTIDYAASRVPAAEREHRHLTRALTLSLLRCGYVSVTKRIGLSGTAHVQGSLTAGDDPRTSVVDSLGRVHGLESLYVVDGSVLARSGRANPSLTIYAWALRVADLLAPTLSRRRSREIAGTTEVIA